MDMSSILAAIDDEISRLRQARALLKGIAAATTSSKTRQAQAVEGSESQDCCRSEGPLG